MDAGKRLLSLTSDAVCESREQVLEAKHILF